MRIRDFILGLAPDEERLFFSIIKSMADRRFSLCSKIIGYTRIYSMAARNLGLVRRILKNSRNPVS
jgi:hypothetical protein